MSSSDLVEEPAAVLVTVTSTLSPGTVGYRGDLRQGDARTGDEVEVSLRPDVGAVDLDPDGLLVDVAGVGDRGQGAIGCRITERGDGTEGRHEVAVEAVGEEGISAGGRCASDGKRRYRTGDLGSIQHHAGYSTALVGNVEARSEVHRPRPP